MADEGWCVWIRHCPHPSVPDTACQPRVLTVCRGRCVRRVVVRVDATFWEGEPFASKSPGSRTRPPAVTPYRPYSRCGTNLIECAESARGRRAEWGDVSSSIRYLNGGCRWDVAHEASVSARERTRERTGSRVEVGKHTGLSSCDRLRGHGPGGMRAFVAMGMRQW